MNLQEAIDAIKTMTPEHKGMIAIWLRNKQCGQCQWVDEHSPLCPSRLDANALRDGIIKRE